MGRLGRGPLGRRKGRPVTPAEIVRTLSDLTKELDRLVKELKAAEHVAAIDRHAADLAESRAFLVAEGAMDMRKHKARVESEQQELAALTAEAEVRGLRAQVRAVETRIDVGRSFGAAVRAELKTLGYEGSA